MSVKYILNQAGLKIGLSSSKNAATSRAVLLRYLNEAARELYAQADLPGTLLEQTFKVNGDQTISVPYYVGRIRGVREAASMQAWHLNQMRPRYNQFNWPDMWRNIRLKNKQALQVSVTNESVGVLTVKEVENPPVVVTLSGPTTDANLIHENITMDSVSKESTNDFIDYIAVKKDRANNFDITLSDIDGKVLTVIPNNELEAKYQIFDISSCPWLPQDTSTLDNYVEILFKKTLPYLSADEDEFPAQFDYDDAIVNKILQLWFEEQGKVELAKEYDSKATRTVARLREDQEASTEDVISLVAHPHDTILKRIGTGIRRRYSLFAGRKY